ncbi:bifunctional DNA primase/polymerase [Okeania sp. SIO1F9]|uniref:bifunctional DNA primase/polymerase n=1 Tax=Okeania sp. SIO1F9 TaxID=2607813 RepID=UPI00144E963F|nr:bifunctional DNA primase/polymerase [Okeania sp. SIO1F9]NET77580.1 hypothetical protein [Okeania sp. SIO1F9]
MNIIHEEYNFLKVKLPTQIMQNNMTLKETYSTNPEINEAILWLLMYGYSPLPVAPAQNPYRYPGISFKINDEKEAVIQWTNSPLTTEIKPRRRFNGKNPSYLDRDGKPYLVLYKRYLNRLPSESQLKTWFANPMNGIGTMGGQNNTVWLDIDSYHFISKDDCQSLVQDFLNKSSVLQKTFIEQTQSGGWRIGVRVKEDPNFRRFSFHKGGKQVGVLLRSGQFTVLAPTIGPSGESYRSVQRIFPVEIESLESIGIYPALEHIS